MSLRVRAARVAIQGPNTQSKWLWIAALATLVRDDDNLGA
ncbi:hypothetical protein M2319_003146 [Rhodobium gokarnense]|uniref:Transposase n=1 Tax=Rhodobium gokarnense TaxID=364296 RepID=A0ABT3HEH1_9HYPH|nr:hypothetical protein [Rhodobium gokarnense]